MASDAQSIAQAERPSNLPAGDHTVTDADLVAAMNCRPELLNGCGDVLAAELFAEPMHRDIASLFLLGLRSPQIEQRIRDNGAYSDEQVTAELRELDDLSLSLYPERIDKAVAAIVDPRHIESRLSELPTTDLGNAQRFVVRHGHNLRFTKVLGWLAWDGRRWRPNDTGEVERRAKHTVRRIYAEAGFAQDKAKRKALGEWAAKCESAFRIRNLIELAWSEPMIAVTADQFDRHPYLLNVANGTIDLRTGELREHRRQDFLTKFIPHRYDAQATCDGWLKFLGRIFAGNERLISFLQRAAGYSLTGDCGERVLFLMYGTGANGKTVFLEVMRAVLGDYAMRTPAQTLMMKRGDSIPNDVARLRGARFVTASETDDNRRFAEALIKDLTGDDTIPARFFRAEWFEFVPEFKLWLATNHKPVIRGTDDAIWDRIPLIPFTVTIPRDERDKDLKGKLRAEAEGILAWLVDGCQAWRKRGLDFPLEVTAATAEYRAEMDVVGTFIDEHCIVAEQAICGASQLYEAFTKWSEQAGEHPITQRAFGLALRERGFDKTKRLPGTGRKAWSGIALLETETLLRCDP